MRKLKEGCEMKRGVRMQGWVVWVTAILFGAWCLPPIPQRDIPPFPLPERFPGGWKEYFDLEQKAAFLESIIIMHAGVRTYGVFEERYPKTFRELCESPYSPLKCADIPNVFTNKPLVETPPGEIGAIEFKILAPGDGGMDALYFGSSRSNTKDDSYERLEIRHWRLHPFTGEIVITLWDRIEPVHKLIGWTQRLKKFLQEYARSSPGFATAYAVQEALELALLDYMECGTGVYPTYRDTLPRDKKTYPTSMDELLRTFHFLEKLRNGYTGGYARYIPYSPGVKGNPGDFTIEFKPDNPKILPDVFVFVEGGQTVDYFISYAIFQKVPSKK